MILSLCVWGFYWSSDLPDKAALYYIALTTRISWPA